MSEHEAWVKECQEIMNTSRASEVFAEAGLTQDQVQILTRLCLASAIAQRDAVVEGMIVAGMGLLALGMQLQQRITEQGGLRL